MDCKRVKPWIGPWMDGELAPARTALLLDHLKKCPSCQAERHAFDTIARSLARDGEDIDLEQAWERVCRSLPVKETPRLPHFGDLRRALAAAAVVALAVAAGLALRVERADRYVATVEAPILDLASYLGALARGETAAEQWEAQFSGRDSRAAEGAALPARLGGFSLDGIRVLELKCCRAYRATYRSDRQTLYVIFDPHPHAFMSWAGEREGLEKGGYRSLEKGGLRCLSLSRGSALAVAAPLDENNLARLLDQFENKIAGWRS